MRKGPHPLPVHLGMIASKMSEVQGTDFTQKAQQKITQAHAVEIMRGIKMYQEHGFVRKELKSEVAWEEGVTKLLRPVPENDKASGTPLLVIPSLINKSHILDISEKKSFIRWCAQQGINVYLLDWGDLISEEDICIEDIVKKKLGGAIRYLSEASGGSIDVMGYCMGGTLLLGAHHFDADYIRRMIFLAAPYDFEVDGFELARYVRISSQSALALTMEKGYLGTEYLQALFASLDPDGSAQKFIRFAAMDQGSADAELFVAVEDWLNDSVPLPEKIASHCIEDWFLKNKPKNGAWTIGGDRIENSDISKPSLIITSNKDKLVPQASVEALEGALHPSYYEKVLCSCGHIGLIIGRDALQNVWRPIADFVLKK